MTFNYKQELKDAIHQFWDIRKNQKLAQKVRNVQDQGSRGEVTGGQQLNGFLDLLKKISADAGVPDKCIYIKKTETHIPGYFRPTKSWDFIIVSGKKKLIACLELKSQVGPSFGNNLNNRTEEALGNAVDLITACRQHTFSFDRPPWLGFILIVEKCGGSIKPVTLKEPHFKTRKEFIDKSYLERYDILCKKLMLEKLYDYASLIWTENKNGDITVGEIDKDTSFEEFVNAFYHYLLGRKNEF